MALEGSVHLRFRRFATRRFAAACDVIAHWARGVGTTSTTCRRTAMPGANAGRETGCHRARPKSPHAIHEPMRLLPPGFSRPSSSSSSRPPTTTRPFDGAGRSRTAAEPPSGPLPLGQVEASRRSGDRLKRARRATFPGLHGGSELEHDHLIDEDLVPRSVDGGDGGAGSILT